MGARAKTEARKAGFAELAARDPEFRATLESYGLPPSRKRPRGFETLLRAIVAQQVSVAAATSIYGRVEALAHPLSPQSVLAVPVEALRAAGLSRMKAGYAHDLARASLDGRLDFRRIARMGEADAVAALTSVKGIGRWSAEIYLLFAEERHDVMPIGDLALQVAAQRMKALRRRPTPRRLEKMAAAWRPWRGLAAEILWHYYKHAPVL
jgi:DNA-3-methyladenine glycosylase II